MKYGVDGMVTLNKQYNKQKVTFHFALLIDKIKTHYESFDKQKYS